MMILLPTKEIANSIQPATPDEVDTGAAIDGDVFTKIKIISIELCTIYYTHPVNHYHGVMDASMAVCCLTVVTISLLSVVEC